MYTIQGRIFTLVKEDGLGIKRVAIFNDVHGPWHDPAAVDAVISVYQDVGVTDIYINGDLIDFYNINAHVKNKHPEVYTILEDEIDWGYKFLSKLRDTFPDAKIHFLFGNHEWRLERDVIANARSYYNLLQLHKHLRLKELCIEWYNYNQRVGIIDNLGVQHSPPSYSKNGAMVSLEKKADITMIYGCTHREQTVAKTGGSGRVYRCRFNGWLGSTSLTSEHFEVFRYAKGHEDWQQAACLVDIINGKFFIHPISFQDGMTCLEGTFYTGDSKEWSLL